MSTKELSSKQRRRLKALAHHLKPVVLVGATVASHLSFDLSFDVGRNARRLAASVFYRF